MGKKKKAKLSRAEKRKKRRARKRGMPGARFAGPTEDFAASESLSNEEKWKALVSGIARGTIPPEVVYHRMLEVGPGEQEMGVQLLHGAGTRETLKWLKTFALGKDGHEEARMLAARLLSESDVFPQGEPVRLWVGGAWKDVRLREAEISPEFHSTYSSRIHRMIDQGTNFQHDGKWKQAGKIWTRILEINPEVKEAYYNLATCCEQRGGRDQAIAYMKQALEIDPLYVFPRCGLALFALNEDRVEDAREWIRPLSNVTQFHPKAMRTYLYVQGMLAAKDRDFEAAERHFVMALELDPEHEGAKTQMEWLGIIKTMGNIVARQREEHQKKRERKRARPIEAKAPLAACLRRLTKHNLMAMARALHLSKLSGKRKEELVVWLVAWIPERLDGMVRSLSDREREALRYVSEEGGMISWEGFSKRFGDEAEDSLDWIYRAWESKPGMRGLLTVGSVEGVQTVLIPFDLRDNVRDALEGRAKKKGMDGNEPCESFRRSKKGAEEKRGDVSDADMAGQTRLELATLGVTGRYSNQTELLPRASL